MKSTDDLSRRVVTRRVQAKAWAARKAYNIRRRDNDLRKCRDSDKRPSDWLSLTYALHLRMNETSDSDKRPSDWLSLVVKRIVGRVVNLLWGQVTSDKRSSDGLSRTAVDVNDRRTGVVTVKGSDSDKRIVNR